jgi:hypothetical protein
MFKLSLNKGCAGRLFVFWAQNSAGIAAQGGRRGESQSPAAQQKTFFFGVSA